METRDIKGVRRPSVHSWIGYEMLIGRLGRSLMIIMSGEVKGSQVLHIKGGVSG